MASVQGLPQLQARLHALQGAQKMKLLAAAAQGELRKNSPGQRTRLTANSWRQQSVSETHAVLTGSIVNLWLDQGTGLYGPRHARITPKAARAMRWAATASKGFRLSGAARAVKGNVIGYAFATSTKGMEGRPFINRSLQAVGGEVGVNAIVTIWNQAS